MLFQLYWEFAAAENTQPLNPYIIEFVSDTQNVHTAVVSEKTNKIEELLLSYSKPAIGLGVLDYFEGNWEMDKLIKDDDPDVYEDMKYWYNTESCIKQSDNYYRKLLNGLFHYIQSKPIHLQIELLRRAYQECIDAVGLCCQGHIVRICNVLIGFEEGVVVEQSIGQKLQDKIAEIAISELSIEEKKKQANEFMDSLKISQADKDVWLAALGE